jgi:hypothetical protein
MGLPQADNELYPPMFDSKVENISLNYWLSNHQPAYVSTANLFKWWGESATALTKRIYFNIFSFKEMVS